MVTMTDTESVAMTAQTWPQDLCWAMHSDCQGTIVDNILEASVMDQKHVLRAFFTQLAQALGTDLDWPAGWPKSAKGHAIPFASPLLKEALRHSGLGLWLHDRAALRKVRRWLSHPFAGEDGFHPADIAPAVEELLRTAVAATAEAPNRAVKRRVRQRLHKKLGAVLNKEEFDRAMERFHDAVEAQRLQQEENLRAQKRGNLAAQPVVNRAAAVKPSPAFVAVPVVMGSGRSQVQ
ncbi:DmX-like protein 2 [Durusdinium trenchii]|uniref:DmX-like protein 2 n=1 Tax=Durusdinium trenchii TaxID=1381693 RepID=A0ABP0MZ07_9DINO